jgi:hypothetical protein
LRRKPQARENQGDSNWAHLEAINRTFAVVLNQFAEVGGNSNHFRPS